MRRENNKLEKPVGEMRTQGRTGSAELLKLTQNLGKLKDSHGNLCGI